MKNKYIFSLIMALTAFLTIPVSSWAGEEKGLIEVIATGIGKDSDSALKNALRAAIEQAVGTLVDSETLANNDEVVNDQILSYSAGFVESHKVVGEPKKADGLVTIKIAAQVRRTNLVEKLKAASIHTKEVDGESLFGEAITKMEQTQSAAEIIAKAFVGFPGNILEVKTHGKPKYDEQAKKMTIEIEIKINTDSYRTFTKKLSTALKQISQSSTRSSQTSTVGQISYGTHMGSVLKMEWLRGALYNKNVIAICMNMNEARTNGTWELFEISREALVSVIDTINKPVINIEIVNTQEETVVSGVYNSPVPLSLDVLEGYWRNKQYKGEKMIYGFAIYPVLNTRSGVCSEAVPGLASTTFTIGFDVSPDEIRKMKNIICRVEDAQ